MAQNEKIRTPDVVEISDVKVLTSQAHPQISVIAGETYDSVLTKVAAQILSAAQKAAFDNTLTVPSASNPVVLKNDIDTYVPAADLGEVKDSVATFALLPLPFSLIGDTTLASDHLTSLSYTTLLRIGQTVSGAGIPVGAKVQEIVSTTELILDLDATATAADITITFSPTVGDLRGVIADNIIYRWTGLFWDPFITTGTLDHTELVNKDGEAAFVHLTSAEKTSLLALSHVHANDAVLDAITSAGSGAIITVAERAQLPTQDQKDALIGTSGTPNAANRYVTNFDPRLLTIRNPYVTVGPPGSLATYVGIDFRPFTDALAAIFSGSASAVKAIETLPGTFDLGGVSLVWDVQPSGLLLEAWTPGSVVLQFRTFQGGIIATGPGTGPVTIRGFVFEVSDFDTAGIEADRDNMIIEDCTFRVGGTISTNQRGVIVTGSNVTIRRCRFEQLDIGVTVDGNSCRIEECVFDMKTSASSAVLVKATREVTFVDHCKFLTGTVKVEATAANNQITNCFFTDSTSSIDDLGDATRIIENIPQLINQPYNGARKTIGPVGSFADYRSTDQAAFVAAFADPLAKEFEVLAGTYTFTAVVTIPTGMTLKGTDNGFGGVTVTAAGVNPFILSSNSEISGITITGSNESLVSGSGLSGAKVTNCTFNLTAVALVSDWAVSFVGSVDCTVADCKFLGVRGFLELSGNRTNLINNHFANSTATVTTIASSSCHFKDNYFIGTPAPNFGGIKLIVEGNHFLGTLPLKTSTTDSVWQANYPHPNANNETAVDSLKLSLDRFLTPITATASTLLDSGAIAYDDGITASANTVPIALGVILNRSLGYTAGIYWTSPVLSGNVVWRVTAVFRDALGLAIGTSAVATVLSTRTGASTSIEDLATATFTTLQYGLPIGVDPTHVSFTVERVGTDVADTLVGTAYVIEVMAILPRV